MRLSLYRFHQGPALDGLNLTIATMLSDLLNKSEIKKKLYFIEFN